MYSSEILHQPISDHERFREQIAGLSERDQWDLDFAYACAKYGHRNQLREGPSQERYFEHVRRVFNILWEELVLPGRIPLTHALPIAKASFLHDVGEDTGLFFNPAQIPYEEWRKMARNRFAINFGEETADLILAVTIPVVQNDSRLDTKGKAKAVAHENLRTASPKAKILKMQDRLANLHDLHLRAPQDQIKKIKETREVYFPIFETILPIYPEATAYLMYEMEAEMLQLEAALRL